MKSESCRGGEGSKREKGGEEEWGGGRGGVESDKHKRDKGR